MLLHKNFKISLFYCPAILKCNCTAILKFCCSAILNFYCPAILKCYCTAILKCYCTAILKAQVTPLLKKDGMDPESVSSYRPISNLNTISKILEKLFMARLKPHISRSRNFSYISVSLSSVSQHGNGTIEDSGRCLLLDRCQANNVSCRLRPPIGCFRYYRSRNTDSSFEVKFRHGRRIIVLDFFLPHRSMAACEIRWHQLNSSQM